MVEEILSNKIIAKSQHHQTCLLLLPQTVRLKGLKYKSVTGILLTQDTAQCIHVHKRVTCKRGFFFLPSRVTVQLFVLIYCLRFGNDSNVICLPLKEGIAVENCKETAEPNNENLPRLPRSMDTPALLSTSQGKAADQIGSEEQDTNILKVPGSSIMAENADRYSQNILQYFNMICDQTNF